MKAVLTVGSTEFTPLVRSFLSLDTLKLLHALGVTSIVAQVGNSSLPPGITLGTIDKAIRLNKNSSDSSVHVTVLDFTSQIEKLVAQADIVVSHAGAGSILSAIRPLSISRTDSTQHKSTADKILIIVPNSTLMDSHQTDLADEFERHGWAIVVRDPNDLPLTINKLIQQRSSVTIEPTMTTRSIPAFDNSKINRILDETLKLS
ncbi:hypothetical protein ACM66B_000067 [Microbotryomycetes sp. NB124-2]